MGRKAHVGSVERPRPIPGPWHAPRGAENFDAAAEQTLIVSDEECCNCGRTPSDSICPDCAATRIERVEAARDGFRRGG